MNPETIPQYIELGFMIVGAASAIAAIVPIPQAVVPLIVARKILDMLAFNFGRSRNAVQPGEKLN
jgi:hypothetical protein